MTVNEAIEILKVAKAECEWNAPLDYQAAFDTVIDYLSEPTEAITEEVVANILLVPTCSNCGQVISDVQVVPNEWYLLLSDENIRHPVYRFIGSLLRGSGRSARLGLEKRLQT